MIKAYHGTTRKLAKEILKNGFLAGTCFTNHFDSAVAMGGPFVFHVIFDEEFKCWEYISSEIIPKEKIIALQKISAKNKYYNPQAQQILSNQYKTNICLRCAGRGELTYKADGHHLLPRGSSLHNKRKIVVCPDCHGYGDLDEAEKMGFI